MVRLYHYWRSSSSWRVRWALMLKQVECEYIPVNLLDEETELPPHQSRNPMGYVPVLEFSDPSDPKDPAERFLTESSAIIEWAEERFPHPTLLPGSPERRAQIRRLCELINSNIQPLQNPNVVGTHTLDPAEQKKWCQLWIRKGLAAYQKWITCSAGRFSVGNELTMADLYLIPQCYSALRFGVDLKSEFPVLEKIYTQALLDPHCQASHPDRFADPLKGSG